jgi:uncharacterized protein YqjF (DUF2071 family)
MSSNEADGIDRLSIRERPDSIPLMQQNWGKLLFMHWRIEVEHLRPHIPTSLTIDTYDDSAWIAVTPFTMWDVRLSFTPPVPWLSDFHELNVRTYVHHKGVPGVWFFSLDTNSLSTVLGARAFYHLPYFHAQIELAQAGATIDYKLRRHEPNRSAEFAATYTAGTDLPEAQPGSLEFFLTERYCLYAASGERLYRSRIHHCPWPLQQATLGNFRSTMIESHGLPPPAGAPLLHYAEALAVDIWPLEHV